jgi:diguanylate cyclase (GGDEF)-like protein
MISPADALLALTAVGLAFELGRVRRRERRAAEMFRDLENTAHDFAEAFDPAAIAARGYESARRLSELKRFELFLFDENDRVREVWSGPGGDPAALPVREERHPRLQVRFQQGILDRLTATETSRSFAPAQLQDARRGQRSFHLPLYSGSRAIGYWELEFAAPLDSAGVDRLRAIYRSLTDAVYAEGNFRLAARDALSSLFVRRYFDGRLAGEIARSARSGRPLALAVFDLDHFKAINDRHGHPAGDEVIRSFGTRLQGALRQPDLSARRGGEEFAVFFPETDAETARIVCERVRRMVAEEPVPWESAAIPITVSAGIAAWEPGDTAEALLARADAALYAAKNAGRNRVIVAGR